MLRFRISPANIYLKCGLVLLALGVACAVLLYALWPMESRLQGQLLSWGTRFGLLGGLVLYVIGRIAGIARRRSRA